MKKLLAFILSVGLFGTVVNAKDFVCSYYMVKDLSTKKYILATDAEKNTIGLYYLEVYKDRIISGGVTYKHKKEDEDTIYKSDKGTIMESHLLKKGGKLVGIITPASYPTMYGFKCVPNGFK